MGQVRRFPSEVKVHLKYYVYRLIDPRNGETFYVGKGKSDRVFQHAFGSLDLSVGDEDADDAKMQRIKEIRSAGLEVAHVIHRHGIENEDVAFQIEAAVMDCYPGLTNKVGGRRGSDFGVAHAEEIIALYGAKPFVPRHRLLLINIADSYEDDSRSVYDAVRYAWRLSPDRAEKVELVLAHAKGIVVDVFKPIKWIKATEKNFPGKPDRPGRLAFEGTQADGATRKLYQNKRVPDRYRPKGAANPVRWVDPD
jgi:hypothetical protein